MHRTLHPAVIVTPDHETGGYMARTVDIEVASQGETEQEALDVLTEVLELYFEYDEEAARRLRKTVSRVTWIDIRLPA